MNELKYASECTGVPNDDKVEEDEIEGTDETDEDEDDDELVGEDVEDEDEPKSKSE